MELRYLATSCLDMSGIHALLVLDVTTDDIGDLLTKIVEHFLTLVARGDDRALEKLWSPVSPAAMSRDLVRMDGKVIPLSLSGGRKVTRREGTPNMSDFAEALDLTEP